MKICRLALSMLFILSVLSVFIFPVSEGKNLESILEKNIEASGGSETISKISAVSFEQIGTQSYSAKPVRYIIGGKDRIKILEGTSPLVEKTIIFNEGIILADSVVGPVPPESINKTEMYCFARLISGNFSLYYFKDKLKDLGIRKIGSVENHILQTVYDSAEITFIIDSTTYLLSQMVIEQNTGTPESFKTIYDIYPKGDVNGYNIPPGYYKSEMGNENSLNYGYGEEYLFRNFKQNEKLAENEFDKAELNFGEVSVAEKSVNGNVTAASYNDQYKRGVYYTNIGKDILEKAKMNENDVLIFQVGEKKFQSVYIKSQTSLTRELSQPGKVIISVSARTPFHIVLFYGDDFKDMVNQTSLLSKISITKE